MLMQIPPGPPLGDLVVRAEGVNKGYGDNLLLEDLTFDLPRGGIVGIIGPNGAGKTTLFRMIVGQEKPDGGKLRVGDTVKIAYVDQNRDALNDEKTVFEEITGGTDYMMLGKQQGGGRGVRGAVQLQGAGPAAQGRRTVRRRAQPRPPGQAAAVAAATCCCWTSRPTTWTWTRCGRWRRRSSNFGGCAVVISHDRWFLDRIATHILAFEGDSKVVWCEGNFESYEENSAGSGSATRPTSRTGSSTRS